MEVQVGGRYALGSKIGSGYFGEVHLGTDKETKKDVAIKMEPVWSPYKCLGHEIAIYAALAHTSVVPRVHWRGFAGDYRVMVMDLLGPSIEDLFQYCNRKFSLKTVLLLADQIITCLEVVHSHGFLHRDIKPDNFLIGLGPKSDKVHIIDFGLAERYVEPKTGKHRPCRKTGGFTGTAHYLSLNTHLGMGQGRRDDLESAWYVMVYLLRGSLPWQDINGGKPTKPNRIRERKLASGIEDLCGHFPLEFATFVRYCRGLAFDERPDYAYLRTMMRDLFVHERFVDDCCFDWTMLGAVHRDACSLENQGEEEGVSSESNPTVQYVDDTIKWEPNPAVSFVENSKDLQLDTKLQL